MALRDMLVDRMNVLSPGTPTKDTSAGPLQTFNVIAESIPCQINELSANERITAAIAGMNITHEILTVYSGVQMGFLVQDVETGVKIRVLGATRNRKQGTIETYFTITGEEEKT